MCVILNKWILSVMCQCHCNLKIKLTLSKKIVDDYEIDLKQ